MWVFGKHFNCSSMGRERGKMGNIWEIYKVGCHKRMVGHQTVDQEDRVRNRHGSKLRQLDFPLCLCLLKDVGLFYTVSIPGEEKDARQGQ